MSLIAKLSISLVITAIASALTTTLLEGSSNCDRSTCHLVAFFLATTATAILVGAGSLRATTYRSVSATAVASDASREEGTVKWFNVSKGFGFIVREDGEEIFVHFRSIRGEGRRSLRDGQSVSFVVTQSDKGPQAEDVVGEN